MEKINIKRLTDMIEDVIGMGLLEEDEESIVEVIHRVALKMI